MRQRSISETGVVLAVLCLVSGGPVAAGHYVEQTVTSSQSGMNLEVKAWTEGDHAKVEFTRSDSDFMPAGSYLLTTDGGRTVYLVKPAERTYSVWDIEALFKTFGEVMQSAEGVVNLDFKDAESEELGSEPGGELLGFDTTKKSWRTAYSMDMKVAFMEQSHRMETTTDAWITKEIANPSLGIWFTVQPPTTGDPDLDLILTEGMERIEGTPLKIVQSSTTTGKKGRTRSSDMTMEVTEYREEPVDTASFVVPEGYEEVPFLDFGGGQGTAEGQEDQNPLKSLGGLFGGKKKKRKNDG